MENKEINVNNKKASAADGREYKAAEAAITLGRSEICRGMSRREIEKFISDNAVVIKKYSKGQIIYSEGDPAENIMILVSGKVSVSRITLSGRMLAVTEIKDKGDMFGEVFVFMNIPYRVNAMAEEDSEILELPGRVFTDNHDSVIYRNMMTVFARKAYMLSRRVQVLASPSIREKIVRFISDKQSESGASDVSISREVMADYMGVTRPSLSRELGKMQKEGIISINGRTISVSDPEKFEEYL